MKTFNSSKTTQIAARFLIPFLMTLIVGCATPVKYVTQYQTVEVTRNVFVPVPGGLTEPVEIVTLPDNGGFRNADTLQLGAAYKAQVVRAKQCNGQLAAIKNLKEKMP